MKSKSIKLAAPPLTAWSISRLLLWEGCPRRAYYKHVAKLPEAVGAAMERGDRIHKALEAYEKGRVRNLTPEVPPGPMRALAKRVRLAVRRDVAKAEFQLAFDRAWRRVDWFAKDAYVRMMADRVMLGKDGHAEVGDWKTGKVRPSPDYQDQLELNCIGALAAGYGTTAHGQLDFTDHGVSYGAVGSDEYRVITLAELPALQKKWDRRAAGLLADTTFRPTPSHACNWCPWSKDKGGPCEY
jgi:hypothetical protein